MSEHNLPHSLQPRLVLLSASIVIVVVWCWLLPRVATHPAVRQRLELLDRHGVDASVMFYTELDAMNDILNRLEER